MNAASQSTADARSGRTIQLEPSHLEALQAAEAPSEWLVWQLVDSAFPSGGFAHSGGLEAAWQQGQLQRGADLVSYCEACLEQVAHTTLPFVNTAHDRPLELVALDALCDVFTSNHVANRASRIQGSSFYAAVTRIFKGPLAVGELSSDFWFPRPPCGHFAPLFGAVLRYLGLPRIAAGRAFMFAQLRGLISAALRLSIVGPIEAQRLQYALSDVAEAALKSAQGLADIAQTAPLLDLWQGAHDRLHSRLFQS